MGGVAAGNRLRFTLVDQDGARQMVRASLPDVHGEALLLCGGQRAEAIRLTEQTFAWLGREIRGGRETVTLGRLLLVLRHHFLEDLPLAGRRRRRARAAVQAIAATRVVVERDPAADAAELLSALPQLARAVAVLLHVDRMLLPDVAAALRLPEETVAEIDELVLRALQPVGGIAALRAAVTAGPPPLALTGRVLAPLIDAVNPVYLAPVASAAWWAPITELDDRPAAQERPSRRSTGLLVALAIVGVLAAATAARQLAAQDPPPATPAPPAPQAPAPCTTLGVLVEPIVPAPVPIELPAPGRVSSPPAACPAP
jgi:hypothetical protein